MANKKRKPAVQAPREADLMFEAGIENLRAHSIFSPLLYRATIMRQPNPQNLCPRKGYAAVQDHGTLYIHPDCLLEASEWQFILAHCLLHLAFEHFVKRDNQLVWNIACDVYVTRFLREMKLGKPLADLAMLEGLPRQEESIYQALLRDGVPPELYALSTAGAKEPDMIFAEYPPYRDRWSDHRTWQEVFTDGLIHGVSSALEYASGIDLATRAAPTKAQRAQTWFIHHYPLLGALAASFKVVEDAEVCYRFGISIAAVDAEQKTVYFTPAAGLSEAEYRFVMAHELLHVALRHQARCKGRDPYLWNVACDYVINGWLIEMQIGSPPAMGLLHDPSLKNMSAEEIYDLIVNDMRRYRKLATLRGIGVGDILGDSEWWKTAEGVRLDEFYRRCLANGLSYHYQQARGYLPGDLVEEIQALAQPPIPWDVELAHWFDVHFPPIEKTRSYARQSRRQASTPDIPRPRYVTDWRITQDRTFGVVLDTSGSMDPKLLGKGLGAIASYSMAHDVPLVRVIFCDAAAHDLGYIAPEDIAGRVKVRGRGGTVLQPGINFLEHAENFPKKGPVLVITDTFCEDHLEISRPHAFLIPNGHRLPFHPKGDIFYIE